MNININPLRAGAWLFFGTIIIYLMVLKLTPANYEVNIKEANSDSTFRFVNLYDFKNTIEKADDIIILDISSEEKYMKSHLKDAINIPAADILKKSNLKSLKDKRTYIYSRDENHSYEIAFLLMQMGIKALPISGDYELISKYIEQTKEHTSYGFYHGEKAKYNYSIYFGGGTSEKPETEAFKIPDAKTLGAKGGC